MAKSKTPKKVTEAAEPIQHVACNGTGLENGEMGSNLCVACEGSGTIDE